MLQVGGQRESKTHTKKNWRLNCLSSAHISVNVQVFINLCTVPFTCCTYKDGFRTMKTYLSWKHFIQESELSVSCWEVKTVLFFISLTFQSLLSYLKNIFKNAVVHFWTYLDIQTLLSEPCHYEKNTAGRSARIYKKQDRTEKNIEAKRIMIAAFQELFNKKTYTSKICLIFFSSWFPMMFFLQMV